MPAPLSDSAAFDALAAAGDDARAFLRARWFGDTRHCVPRAGDGEPLAALALAERRKGPFRLHEIGGAYWPFRGVPIAPTATPAALADAMRSARRKLGSVFRLGPVIGNDGQIARLREAARLGGWRVLSRPVGQSFIVDLAALKARGNWPSARGAQKDRWRVRQMAKTGPVAIRRFTGKNWSAGDRDAIAAIEGNSWVGQLASGGDTKFHDPAMRRYWEEVAQDPVIGDMIRGMIMYVGETPVAFTFGLDCGTTRYCIANNFDRNFNKHSPGRVLLYADFEAAHTRGIERIDWGLGDAGYKSEMGAHEGPEMIDLLFVANPLVAMLAKPVWERAPGNS